MEHRMARLGDDSSPPAQDSLDSSCPDIKLPLGRQEEGVQEVMVNREALAGLSPVFKSMLTHDMAEKNQGTVRLEAVSLKTWKAITAFYFSEEKRVTLGNVQEVVSFADMYELTDLKEHCDNYLCENADEFQDFSDLLNWATTFKLDNLKRNLLKLVREDFELFSESECFLRLRKEVLLEILSGPYIVGSEDIVCMAVLRWLQDQNVDSESVEQVLHQLKLNEVCLPCLEKHVRESQYAEIGDVALQFIEKEKGEREKESVNRMSVELFAQNFEDVRIAIAPNKIGKPYAPTCRCEFAEGGRTFFTYDGHYCDNGGVFLDGTEVPLRKFATPSAICIFEYYLVVSGAYHPKSPEFYDLVAKRWIFSPRLLQRRENNGMVSIGDALYVVMGKGNDRLASIEVFTSDVRKWRRAGRMRIATTDVVAAAAGNFIFASGSAGKERLYQSFNTESKEAVILRRDHSDFLCQSAYSLGSRGVVFVLRDRIICMSLKESGQVAVKEEQRPEFLTVFDEADFYGPDVQCGTEGEEGCLRELQQLVQRNDSNTAFSVRFSLGGKRANITPVPVTLYGFITHAIRR